MIREAIKNDDNATSSARCTDEITSEQALVYGAQKKAEKATLPPAHALYYEKLTLNERYADLRELLHLDLGPHDRRHRLWRDGPLGQHSHALGD